MSSDRPDAAPSAEMLEAITRPAPQTRLQKLRSYIGGWKLLISHLGIRGALQYERDRRAGMTIDYSKVFTEEEIARLSEEFNEPMPWSQTARERAAAKHNRRSS